MYLDKDNAPNINQLTAFRRDLHMHPELKYEESRTADKIAAYLTALGIPMTRGLGTTGIADVVFQGAYGAFVPMARTPEPQRSAAGYGGVRDGAW